MAEDQVLVKREREDDPVIKDGSGSRHAKMLKLTPETDFMEPLQDSGPSIIESQEAHMEPLKDAEEVSYDELLDEMMETIEKIEDLWRPHKEKLIGLILLNRACLGAALGDRYSLAFAPECMAYEGMKPGGLIEAIQAMAASARQST